MPASLAAKIADGDHAMDRRLTGSQSPPDLGLRRSRPRSGCGIWLLTNRLSPRGLDPLFAAIPEKSIAVLPFASLGVPKEDTQFADGIQEAILTNLSKVADLKVISRWSVMRYKPGVDRDTQKIALALRVAYLLDCTIQQAGNRLVVHARLIDGRTDSNVWGNDYSREFKDFGAILGIQTEIATQIVAQLEVRLSPQEKAAIEELSTKDSAAHAKYVSAKSLIEGSIFSPRAQEDLTESVRLLTQAISRDPEFFLAYYELAHAHDQLYLRFDPSAARLGSAESAIQALQRLRPESGETHLAVAKHLYWGYHDYERARRDWLQQSALCLTIPSPPFSQGISTDVKGAGTNRLIISIAPWISTLTTRKFSTSFR